MSILLRHGLTEQTVRTVRLGIKEPYRRADGQLVSGVMAFPLTTGRGRKKYGSINLLGFTENPEHALGWSSGGAEALSYGTGDTVLVCASALEAWLAWQAAEAAGLRLTAVASTQPDATPHVWESKRFWSSWTTIIATAGVSGALLGSIAMSSGRQMERCPPVPTPTAANDVLYHDLSDWITSVVEGDHQTAALGRLGEVLPDDDAPEKVSVHGGLHAGRMYYAVGVERRERHGRNSGFVFSYKTLVIRSDGAVLEPELLPAPPGTPADRRVHALTDGTRIAAGLGVPMSPSWSLPAIRRFVDRAQDAREYDGPDGKLLFDQLIDFLRSVVWLPEEASYAEVACFIMATYFHRLFAAFPILFINGPKASGKSELTAAVVATSFNGSLMAQGSAAALVKLARESGGLVAIDDAEGLNAGFGELAQALKVGYKASTAVKRLVSKSGATEVIDFYGPRVLCNTRGVDGVLGSRCLTVRTAPVVDMSLCPDTETVPSEWRDKMHDFAMTHFGKMAIIAKEMAPSVCERAAELALPCLATSRLIGLIAPD